MKTNFEIYNFLNILSPKLGKQYKLTGHTFLPKNFSFEENLKKLLILKNFIAENNLPEFIFEEKKKIKKYFKNSLKNCKKIKKNQKNIAKNENFDIFSFNFYVNSRIQLTKILLKNFKNYDFDEMSAYNEIFDLNPIYAQLTQNLFEENVDIEELSKDIELKFEISYLEKLAHEEKKQKKKKSSATQTKTTQMSTTKKKTQTKVSAKTKTENVATKSTEIKKEVKKPNTKNNINREKI